MGDDRDPQAVRGHRRSSLQGRQSWDGDGRVEGESDGPMVTADRTHVSTSSDTLRDASSRTPTPKTVRKTRRTIHRGYMMCVRMHMIFDGMMMPLRCKIASLYMIEK